MAKIFYPAFTIKIAPKHVKNNTNTCKKISKKCLAVVIIVDGVYKAKVKIPNDPKEYLILDFTDNSLKLKGKTHVFSKVKSKSNKKVLYIRDYERSLFHPGINDQFEVLQDGILISGYIIRKNSKMLFDYDALMSISELGGRIHEINEKLEKTILLE